jgi:enoyl-CoA hydratase
VASASWETPIDGSRYETIAFERVDEILIATLNRPERLNAINERLREDLNQLFLEARDDPCRVLVITGAGRGFCAGADVKGWGERPVEKRVRLLARTNAQELVERMIDIEKPVIAMVNGPAAGLGSVIALLCDIVVASEEARVGDSHVAVGLVAGDGGAVIYPMLTSFNKAKELLMTADLIDAQEALRIGLFNHVVPADQLRSFTLDIARRICRRAPYAVNATKMSMNRMLKRQNFDVLDASHAWEQVSIRLSDHKEAVASFLEKREPRFTGD